MEYIDRILHQVILIAIYTTFHSIALCSLAHRTRFVVICLVAICISISSFIAGIYRFVIFHKYKTCSTEAFELLLPAGYLLCPALLVWVGESCGNFEVAVCEKIAPSDNPKFNSFRLNTNGFE